MQKKLILTGNIKFTYFGRWRVREFKEVVNPLSKSTGIVWSRNLTGNYCTANIVIKSGCWSHKKTYLIPWIRLKKKNSVCPRRQSILQLRSIKRNLHSEKFYAAWGQFHQRFYVRRSQKRKKESQLKQLFALSGSACLKALRKHIGEIDPTWCKMSADKLKKVVVNATK